MIARLCLIVMTVWVGMATADPLPDAQGKLFLDFAQDVSGNDPKVIAQATALIVTPPTTLEGIGFYGLEDAPAPERTLRGIISILTNTGYLRGTEDKYIYEFPLTLMEEGLIDPAGSKTALDIISYFDGVDWNAGEDPDWPQFKRFFVKHTQAIEKAVANKGNRLLSLQLPLGDTLYFWLAPPDVADRWRNTALYTGVNALKYQNELLVTISVTDPDWKSYWGLMTYALQIPDAHQGLPEGL